MALEDMLLNSGAQNVQMITQGWTKDKAEERAQGLYEAKMDQYKSQADYLPKKREMAQEAHDANIEAARLTAEKAQRDMDRTKTSDEQAILLRNRKESWTIGRGLNDLIEQGKLEESKKAFLDNYDYLVKRGTKNDKGRIDQVKALIESGDDKSYEQAIVSYNAMIPAEQDALNKAIANKAKDKPLSSRGKITKDLQAARDSGNVELTQVLESQLREVQQKERAAASSKNIKLAETITTNALGVDLKETDWSDDGYKSYQRVQDQVQLAFENGTPEHLIKKSLDRYYSVEDKSTFGGRLGNEDEIVFNKENYSEDKKSGKIGLRQTKDGRKYVVSTEGGAPKFLFFYDDSMGE